MMKSYYRLPILAAMLIALSACGSSAAEWHGHSITGVMPDLAYKLTNENGEPVSADAHEGMIRLLFFGYTSCPDICPVTLGRLKAAISTLPKEQQNRVRVLFVSVDPKRDTPEQLRKYTAYFGEQFIGLTGNESQLRELTKRYRVTYGYGENNENGFYEVSHSSGVFVFGPRGEVRLLFNQSVTAADMSEDLKRLLREL